jgi:hypothetical protein
MPMGLYYYKYFSFSNLPLTLSEKINIILSLQSIWLFFLATPSSISNKFHFKRYEEAILIVSNFITVWSSVVYIFTQFKEPTNNLQYNDLCSVKHFPLSTT